MTNTALDQIDLQTLSLLQKDAKLSNKELAHKLHKASNTMYDRVNRLREQGYITGTMTLIDYKKLGERLVCFTQVQLNIHTRDALKDPVEDCCKGYDQLQRFPGGAHRPA